MFYYYLISNNQIILVMNTVELNKNIKIENKPVSCGEVHRSHDSQCSVWSIYNHYLFIYLTKDNSLGLFYSPILPLPENILAPATLSYAWSHQSKSLNS